MTDREKLIKLTKQIVIPYWAEQIADHLIANGVTFQQWIPVTERLPEAFVSVLAHMPDEKPFPTVRECYVSNDGLWISAYFSMEPDEVTHWMPLPTPPED